MDAVTLSTAIAIATATLASPPPVISVNFPNEKAAYGPFSATYILGNVQPPTSKLTVNGKPVALHPKGGFLAYVPLAPGDFTFHLEAVNSSGTAATLDRHVKVDLPFATEGDKVFIDTRGVTPAADVELRPGDWLKVQARGRAGLKGTYKVKGVRRHLPMVESSAGFYEGAYQIRPEDRGSSATITIELSGRHSISAEAQGRLTILEDGPRPAVVSRDAPFEFTPVRGAPGRGYSMFATNGMKILVSGRVGDELRIQLSPTESGWLPASSVKYLPEGTPPPRAVLGTMETVKGDRSTVLKLTLSEKVPYKIDERAGLLKLTLYHTDAHTNWVIFDPKDSNIKDVRWNQARDGITEVEVWLADGASVWGYSAAQNGAGLELELRWPPAPVAESSAPLEGLSIVLDPGHSPSDPGRIGPMGYSERELNLKTARVLETLLKQRGASVTLTRQNNDQEVGLQERVDIAWRARADALISLHNNALGDGVDPYKLPHGYSVFYYHPQSRALAESIYRAYQRTIPLADEGLRYGDLFLPRATKMPSVLIESAYFIFPDQEQLLADDAFQQKLGQALADGITDYFRKLRKP